MPVALLSKTLAVVIAAILMWRIVNVYQVETDVRVPADADQPSIVTALLADPTDARLMIRLAELRLEQGREGNADQLVATAGQMAPMQAAVRLAAVPYWMSRGRIDKVLLEWRVALQLRPKLSTTVFPELLALASEPTVRASAFSVLLEQPPPWWDNFYRYAADHSEDLDTLRGLYYLGRSRSDSERRIERDALLRRLEREGLWVEAYFVWFNALTDTQRDAIGGIYNGQFDLPIANLGFGWRFQPFKSISVERVVDDNNAIVRLTFRGQQAGYRHFYQPLLLKPGRYRLQGQVRTEQLQPETAGLAWIVSCPDSQKQLVQSEIFNGTHDWQPFQLDFTVPAAGCQTQILRLAVQGLTTEELETRGVIEFDNLILGQSSADQDR